MIHLTNIHPKMHYSLTELSIRFQILVGINNGRLGAFISNGNVRKQKKIMGFQKAGFMGPTWGPPGSCCPQVDPLLAHETCYLRYVTCWPFLGPLSWLPAILVMSSQFICRLQHMKSIDMQSSNELQWLLDMIGYWISFPNDGCQNE